MLVIYIYSLVYSQLSIIVVTYIFLLYVNEESDQCFFGPCLELIHHHNSWRGRERKGKEDEEMQLHLPIREAENLSRLLN